MSSYDANLQPHGAQKPGITTKIADKLGMHKGDKVDDHHKVHGTHGTNVVGTANPQHDPLTHTTGHPTGHHTGHGLHDNDPNRIHAQDPVLVHEKDSKPGIGHKIADKLGLHKDDKHVHKDTMVQTPADLHNHPTGVYDNDPNRVQQLHTTQPVHTTNTPGVKDKVKHKLGMDKPHDHLHNTDNVVVGSHPVNPPVHHGTTHTAHTNAMAPEYQHNVNSPGVKDKVEHKLGMDKPHGYHNTDNVVVGGSHPVNTTHPHTTNTHGHTNVVNPEYQQTVNSPSIKDKVKHKLGMDKPHDQHHKDTTLLPKMTPQAEAGSVYSSSMINNNANANANANPTTIEHDRDGHAISTGYTTTGTTHDLPGDSGRMY